MSLVPSADRSYEPRLPAIAKPTADNLIRVVDQIRETIEVREGRRPNQNALDRLLTARDLVKAGVITVKSRAQGSYLDAADIALPADEQDLTPPPAPTGLTASGALQNIILNWDESGFGSYAYTEIWRAATDNLGVAVRIATSVASVYADAVGATNVTYYYWIRFVSTANVTGEFNAVAGVSATTGFVVSADLANLAVTSQKIADGSINLGGTKIAGLLQNANLAVISDPTKIADSLIGNTKLANLAVDAAKLADSAVTATKIASAAVGTAAIQTAAITTALIANLAVGSAQIADTAITSAKIGSAAVGSAAIANLAVTTVHVQDAAIINAKIGNLAVDAAKIVDAAIVTAKIGDLQVTTAKIADANITTAKIANLAVGSAQIANAAISTAKIQNAAIGTLQVAGNAITVPIVSSSGFVSLPYRDGTVVPAGSQPDWSLWTEITEFFVLIPANAGSCRLYVWADFYFTDNDDVYPANNWPAFFDPLRFRAYNYVTDSLPGDPPPTFVVTADTYPARLTYGARIFNESGAQAGYEFSTAFGDNCQGGNTLSASVAAFNGGSSGINYRVELWASAATAVQAVNGGALPRIRVRTLALVAAR